MADEATNTSADQGQRRTSLAQARSRETKHALLQAAIALWRTKGFAETTVADICQAAGVSKALFYFYFPRKEDALLEAGVLSARDARLRWRELTARPYTLPEVIHEVLVTLERTMRRNPPELIIQATLEAYRADHRAPGRADPLFLALLAQAQSDNKLPADLDVEHLSRGVQSLLETATRHWAAGRYGDRSFADVAATDITALITGHTHPDLPKWTR